MFKVIKNVMKIVIIVCLLFAQTVLTTKKPNIVLIIADDLGWNDVGFHGSNEIPTPNIDALAYGGVILNRHYVLPTCTPSRVSLLTAKYPYRVGNEGLHVLPIGPSEPRGLPLNETLLPEYLKRLGYKTHLIGKWHVGHYKSEFTPTRRGFDGHFGYYNGWVRYNDSVHTYKKNTEKGFDAWRNAKYASSEFMGKYVTQVFTEEAIKVITSHEKEFPLFLQISHLAVHAEYGNALKVPQPELNDLKFKHITDPNRRLFAGALTSLDESVGKVVTSLKDNNMLDNTIIVFLSDNGGPTEDSIWSYGNTASNWPLRGMKTSLYEGGVRCVASIWAKNIQKHKVSNAYFHVSDWLPTFYSAAGGDVSELGDIDGVNQWPYLREMSAGMRQEILVNIDQVNEKAAVIFNQWKLVRNCSLENRFNEHVGELMESKKSYDISAVIDSEVNVALRQLENWEKTEILENTEKLENSEKLEKFEILENTEKLENLGKLEKSEKLENSAELENSVKLENSAKLENSGKLGNSGKWEKLENLGRFGNLEKLEKIEVSEELENLTKNIEKLYLKLRSDATVLCEKNSNPKMKDCDGDCLFDILNDPCELKNIASDEKHILKILQDKLSNYSNVGIYSIPKDDENANPKYWNGYWAPWRDYSHGNDSSGNLVISKMDVMSIIVVISLTYAFRVLGANI